MDDPNELAPELRLLMAAGIVFGIVFGGFLMIYNVMFFLPIVMLVVLIVGLTRLFSKGKDQT